MSIIRNKIKTFEILFYNRLCMLMPNYPEHRVIYCFFEGIRQFAWKRMFLSYGNKSYIRSGTNIVGHQNITIGDNCLIGPNSIINGANKIFIGDDFLSGPQLIIYTSEHGLTNGSIPFRSQKSKSKEIKIGNNVYIGARVTILKGVIIGNNVIIATGSVVNKNIPSNQVWGGVPAKKLKCF
ncbi:acyltransferase [Galbibacter sp. PAP.153]|uniref:acyltransferase n=1 Tax=Galbibacter sp. PAP.153 TaxID=3104623 RepID=UPI003009D15B